MEKKVLQHQQEVEELQEEHRLQLEVTSSFRRSRNSGSASV